MNKFIVHTSPSGVSHVYQGADIYCSVHHLSAGGVDNAKARAEQIVSALDSKDELLEALKQVLPFALEFINDNHPSMKLARAAIAKAEGGAK